MNSNKVLDEILNNKEKEKEIINNFFYKINNQKNLDFEFIDIVNKNFWSLI
jgi:hypothetical protein